MQDKNKPLVSVIVPLYNAEKYISETIKSVINQTYENWELLVVDDCSTDNSREIVKSFEQKDSRIRLIESEINFGGPARPRNIGIENAKGEYIAFLDADDVWLKNKLEKQLNLLIENNNFDLIDANAYTIDEKSKKLGVLRIKKVYKILKIFFKKKNIIILSNFVNINTILMKNQNLPRFREDKNLIALEDWMFWIENLEEEKKIYLCDEYLINYRIVSNSISNRNSDKSYRKAYILYSILFFEKKISFLNFLLAFILNSFKIFIRKFKSKLK